MSQEKMVAAFNTIRAVAAASGKKEKIALLKRGDSDYLRELLVYTYDQYRTYRITYPGPLVPKKYNSVTPDIMFELHSLVTQLSQHTLGTLEAQRRVADLCACCTQEDAQIVANVINRDLRAGIDTTTINTAFPGLIPVFNIQLAKPLDNWDRITLPCIIEEKVDEIRCVTVYDGDRARFYSRKGFEFETGMDAFAEEVEQLLPGVPFVLDGGFRATLFNPADPVCRKHGNGNWGFEYAKAISNRKPIDAMEIRCFFTLFIWDVIPLDWFQSQGKKGSCPPVEERKLQLTGMFQRHDRYFNNIEPLPNRLMHSHDQIRQYLKELKAQRKEGCMAKPLGNPYTFGKNFNWVKIKHFVEGDFRILSAYEGEGKYVGMLGGVTIGTDDGKIKCNMGSGFSDAGRVELWVEYLAGRLTGRILECQLKDVTTDGCLQLPTFCRFREDKDNTDTYEELLMKLAGMEGEE